MDNSPENPLISLIRQIVTGPDVLRQQQAQQQQVQQRQSKPQGAPGPPRPAGTQGPPAPDKSKPKPKPSAGKQRQVAEYKREEASVPRVMGIAQRDINAQGGIVPGQVAPDVAQHAIESVVRGQRIASGNENWQPLVGKTTAKQKQFYKDQARLAQQQERGVFGQRLPKDKKLKAEEAGALVVGEKKLKTGEALTKMERSQLVAAGKLSPGPDPNMAAAVAGTLGVMEPGLAMQAETMPVRGAGLSARTARTGATEEAVAAKPVKPPQGEPIGPKAPRAPASRATQQARKAAADEVNAKTQGPGPAPKAKPRTKPTVKSATQEVSAAAKTPTTKSKTTAKAGGKTATTESTADLHAQLKESLKAKKAATKAKAEPEESKPDRKAEAQHVVARHNVTARNAAFRRGLPMNLRSQFDKMLPAEKEEYIKKSQFPSFWRGKKKESQ